MGKNAKKAYLEAIRWRYHQAKRLEKTKILDEFCAVCHYHRKYALRKLAAAPLKTSKSKPGKPSRYNRPDIMKALKVIWLASGQMASKRLQVAIPLWLPQYEKTAVSRLKCKNCCMMLLKIKRLRSKQLGRTFVP